MKCLFLAIKYTISKLKHILLIEIKLINMHLTDTFVHSNIFVLHPLGFEPMTLLLLVL